MYNIYNPVNKIVGDKNISTTYIQCLIHENKCMSGTYIYASLRFFMYYVKKFSLFIFNNIYENLFKKLILLLILFETMLPN